MRVAMAMSLEAMYWASIGPRAAPAWVLFQGNLVRWSIMTRSPSASMLSAEGWPTSQLLLFFSFRFSVSSFRFSLSSFRFFSLHLAMWRDILVKCFAQKGQARVLS